MDEQVEYRVRIHHEDDQLWAEVPDVPGCFASGADLAELQEALTEALSMCLGVELSFEGLGDVVDRVDEHRLLLTV